MSQPHFVPFSARWNVQCRPRPELVPVISTAAGGPCEKYMGEIIVWTTTQSTAKSAKQQAQNVLQAAMIPQGKQESE